MDCTCISLISFSLPANAQKPKQKEPLTRIEFLFDDSQSMYGRWQTGTKIDIAKKLMSDLLDSLRYADNLQLALRVFGNHKKYPPQDCDDTKLEVPFDNNNATKIKKFLNGLNPRRHYPNLPAYYLKLVAATSLLTLPEILLFLSQMALKSATAIPVPCRLLCRKKCVVLKPSFIIGLGING